MSPIKLLIILSPALLTPVALAMDLSVDGKLSGELVLWAYGALLWASVGILAVSQRALSQGQLIDSDDARRAWRRRRAVSAALALGLLALGLSALALSRPVPCKCDFTHAKHPAHETVIFR